MITCPRRLAPAGPEEGVNACDLRQATVHASFKFCDFTGSDLRGADLRRASFAGCDFGSADLSGADLRGARFGWVNTGRPGHGHTDLSDAVVSTEQLRRAVIDESTLLPPG